MPALFSRKSLKLSILTLSQYETNPAFLKLPVSNELIGMSDQLDSLVEMEDILPNFVKIFSDLVADVEINETNEELTKRARYAREIFEALIQYNKALEALTEEIRKNKDKLNKIQLENVQWSLNHLKEKRYQKNVFNKSLHSIKLSTCLLNSLGELKKEINNNPLAQDVYLEGCKLTSKYLNENDFINIDFLNKAIKTTNQSLKTGNNEELIEIVNQASNRPGLKKLAIGMAKIVVAPLIVLLGLTVLLPGVLLSTLTIEKVTIVAGVAGLLLLIGKHAMDDGVNRVCSFFEENSSRKNYFINSLSKVCNQPSDIVRPTTKSILGRPIF